VEYQLKLDGYRAVAFKTGKKQRLCSRNDNDFSVRYPGVLKGLARLSDETVIDGEVVALDDEGRPSFNRLQNYGSAPGAVWHFVFDVMMLAGRDVMKEPPLEGYLARDAAVQAGRWMEARRPSVRSPPRSGFFASILSVRFAKADDHHVTAPTVRPTMPPASTEPPTTFVP
jgi:hypothetical protein